MSSPYYHAISSQKKFGGEVDDFLPVHSWFDESKAFVATIKHRCLRHHTEGIFMCEKIFGPTIKLSNGKRVPTRLIGEQHVLEDLGFIPSFQDWVQDLPVKAWMFNKTKPLAKELG